ncbi:MAG: serine/threonine protein phosphatase [Deltaproteobacteria bacterium]|nr:MAG: serine/threonine protein phosphatase [Deltaproteobacteria bacterium]
MSKVLRLPAHGRLLVCTDLQGNLGDFEAMAAHFRRAVAEDPDTHVVFSGDLVHGPQRAPEDWDPWLGDWYEDDSIGVFEAFLRLAEEHPGRVHALLGNHEHGHVGGVHTAKFHDDEVAALERRMSGALLRRFWAFCAGLPLVAVSPSGVVVTHAAPATPLTGPEELEAVDYKVPWPLPRTLPEVLALPILGPLLWARTCPPSLARGFLAALLGRPDGFVVHGHDIVHEGYEVSAEGALVRLSTSFGCFDAHKRYLDVSLSHRWTSATELREDHELRALYPDAPPHPVWGRDYV